MLTGQHVTAKKKKTRHRTTVMRKVKKFLAKAENLEEISIQRKDGASSNVIDETLVETIMTKLAFYVQLKLCCQGL